MQKLDTTAIRFLYLIGIVLVVIVCLRFIAAFRWAIMSAVIFTGLALSVYFLIKFLREIKADKIYRNSVGGAINEQMKYYQTQVIESKKSIENAQEDIRELENELFNDNLMQRVRIQYGKTINDYKAQIKFQRTKRDFFQLAIEKLKLIKDNHEALKMLKDKQTKLKHLQEANYDSLADLEELKSKLELQKDYVEAIDKLSLKMLDSSRLEDAEVLHFELATMTEELERL